MKLQKCFLYFETPTDIPWAWVLEDNDQIQIELDQMYIFGWTVSLRIKSRDSLLKALLVVWTETGKSRRWVMHAFLAFAYQARFHNSEIPPYLYCHDDMAVVDFSQTLTPAPLPYIWLSNEKKPRAKTTVVGRIWKLKHWGLGISQRGGEE